MYSNYEEKLDWAKTLKVGDVVNDCRDLNLRITCIRPERCIKLWVLKLFANSFVPVGISGFFLGWAEKTKILTEVCDFTLDLEDGAVCSALYCVDDPLIAYKSGNLGTTEEQDLLT